jgi:hypothetical protein
MFSAEITTCVVKNFAAETTVEKLKLECQLIDLRSELDTCYLFSGEQGNFLLVVLVRRTHSPN